MKKVTGGAFPAEAWKDFHASSAQNYSRYYLAFFAQFIQPVWPQGSSGYSLVFGKRSEYCITRMSFHDILIDALCSKTVF